MNLKKYIGLVFLFATFIAIAQIPGGIPSGKPAPIELTPFNIILYIVAPILIFVIYFLYRRSKRRDKDGNN